MKFRADFVTNSSSSSYICVEIESKLLASAIEESIDEPRDEVDYGYQLEVEGDTVIFSESETAERFRVPFDLKDVFPVFCDVLELVRENEATERMQELWKSDPSGCADSIVYCNWTKSNGYDGEFMPWSWNDYGVQEAIDAFMRRKGITDESQIIEEEYDEYLKRVGGYSTEEMFVFNRKNGMEKYSYRVKGFD